MRPADLNTPWATLLVDRLAAAGVAHAAVSPGSRSTPLALACAREPRLRTVVLIDERAAAFYALGAARATGRPALLVCTSGTAAAHYAPAVIEASRAGLPLVVLTADRPPELQHRDAAQTVDQVKLFGAHARRYFELGLPDEDPRALEGLCGTAALAVATALAPAAGPVHLNAWFRKPLEPVPADGPADEGYRAAVDACRARPPIRRFAPRRAPAPEAIAELAARCRAARRGLIVCGPARAAPPGLRPALERAALATGFPVLAEATSQLRFLGAARGAAPRCDLFDPVLRAGAFVAAHAPEIVIQVGGPPVSKGYEGLASGDRAPERWVVTDHGWNEPYNRAAGIVAANPGTTLDALADALAHGPAPAHDWAGTWREAGAAAARALDERLAADPAGAAEARAVRAAVARAGDGLLMLGNSLPVREADLFCTGDAAVDGVLFQRGANGIDGLVAGAAGAAAASGRRVTLLLGDVSLAHDAGGLAAARHAGAPLEIVVLDNGGGRLFELLPVAGAPGLRADFERLFLTPPALDLAALARAYGVDFVATGEPADLAALPAPEPGRPRLVRVVLDGARTRAFHREYLAAVAGALA